MLYLGRKPVYSIGEETVAGASYYNAYSKSLYVKDACLVTNYQTITSYNADYRMDRVFDWLCYDGLGMRENPPSGGFEVEATFIPKRENGWCTFWGTRVGTTGKVTRTNILVDSIHKISQGISYDPSTNPSYGDSIINKKVHVRLICLPTISPQYKHAYSGRIIVEDAESGELLTDETDTFGDNWGNGKNAMFSTVTTFYRFHSSWFSRNRYANPAQNASTGADFEGYFFGGAVYINPTGADETFPTRVPIQILTPIGAGMSLQSKLNPSIVFTNGDADGVFFEKLDWERWINDSNRPVTLGENGMMTNCELYNTAILRYNK